MAAPPPLGRTWGGNAAGFLPPIILRISIRLRRTNRTAPTPPPALLRLLQLRLLLLRMLLLRLQPRLHCASVALTCPRSCRPPPRRAGAIGRGSPPTCPSSRG